MYMFGGEINPDPQADGDGRTHDQGRKRCYTKDLEDTLTWAEEAFII